MPTREEIIEDSETLLVENIPKSQKEVFSEIQTLLKEFPREGGKMKFNSETTKLINQATQRIYKALNKSGYDSRVQQYLKSFDALKESAIAEQKIKNRIDVSPRNLTNIQRSAIQQTANMLLGNGLDARLIQPVKDVLMQSATSGMTIAQAEVQLRQTILGNKETLGKFDRYITQISRDAISQYDGMMQSRIAVEYELDGVSYEGSIIRDSRAQCKRWVEMGEIPINDLTKEIEWANKNGSGMIPKTTKDNFLINRGGFNCRHTATAIRL